MTEAEKYIVTRWKYDGEYAAHITFLNDAKLIVRTFTAVIQARGVVEGAQEDKR